VSTLEVANVLTEAPGVQDAVVYGVDVPGADGKAGMAFLETGGGFDLQRLLDHAVTQLPGYAIPVFLRIGASAMVTETFKHKKQDLAREGFDPSSTSDPIYVRMNAHKTYSRLDSVLHAGIMAGRVRL
jgi:fatty-acyl-CoA synthase